MVPVIVSVMRVLKAKQYGTCHHQCHDGFLGQAVWYLLSTMS